MRKYIYIAIILILIYSCKKDNIFNYINKSDTFVTIDSVLSPVKRLLIYNDLHVNLVSDTLNKIIIKGNEVLVPNIQFVINNDSLIVKNNNLYNWTSYSEKIDIYVHITASLNRIETHTTGILTSSDTLRNPYLLLYAFNMAGEINLNINNEQLVLVSHSFTTTDFNISGKSQLLRTRTRGMGQINTEYLVAEKANIFHEGTNSCIINVVDELAVRIWFVGDVYYKGNPTIIGKDITHKGKLVKLND